jgi:hypothetical protein
MILLNAKQIRDVTSDGVRYVDDQGLEQFIDFAACYDRYVMLRTTPQYWERVKQLNNYTDADWNGYVRRVKNWWEVGSRNILGDYKNEDGQTVFGFPYIEFHTDPPIRFVFEDKGEWHTVRNIIEAAKWRTFDLS